MPDPPTRSRRIPIRSERSRQTHHLWAHDIAPENLSGLISATEMVVIGGSGRCGRFQAISGPLWRVLPSLSDELRRPFLDDQTAIYLPPSGADVACAALWRCLKPLHRPAKATAPYQRPNLEPCSERIERASCTRLCLPHAPERVTVPARLRSDSRIGRATALLIG